MFGRPEWFTYRNFGWGIKAKTWQGWAYIGAFLALLIAPNYLPMADPLKSLARAGIFLLFLADVIIIWIQLDKVNDERQQLAPADHREELLPGGRGVIVRRHRVSVLSKPDSARIRLIPIEHGILPLRPFFARGAAGHGGHQARVNHLPALQRVKSEIFLKVVQCMFLDGILDRPKFQVALFPVEAWRLEVQALHERFFAFAPPCFRFSRLHH